MYLYIFNENQIFALIYSFCPDTNGGKNQVSIKADQQAALKSTGWRFSGTKKMDEFDGTQHSTLENLAPFSNYSIIISAETEEGEGPYSRPIFCSTQNSSKLHLIYN